MGQEGIPGDITKGRDAQDAEVVETPGCMVDGDPASPLLIIGMAPGREELAQNKPFLGGAGKLLWKQLMKRAGISRADCYIINVIGEWPEGIDGNPSKAQTDRYWNCFDESVCKSSARVALLLGTAAIERFAGLTGGVESWRGYLVARSEAGLLKRTVTREGVYKTSRRCKCPFPIHGHCHHCHGTGWAVKKGDPKIEKVKTIVETPWPESVLWAIPTIHPAGVLRTGFGLLPAFAADIARVGRAIGKTLAVKEPEWTDGTPMGESLDATPLPCVFDIETGGIDNDIITRIGATSGTEVWTALWDGKSRDALRDSLAGSHPSAAFNIGFDAPRLAKHGCPIPEPWWDVMLAAATLQPDLKKSLNYVASLYLDKQRHKHLSDSQPAFYNAMDVQDTRDLYYILRPELERTGMLDLFENRMMRTVPVLVDMTQHGIAVDAEVRDQWTATLNARRLETMTKWESLAPGQKTAGSNLLHWLISDLGIPIQYSKYGGHTSEVSALKKLLLGTALNDRQKSTLETLIELRQIEKELRTYAEVGLSGDGRVHPGFLPAGKDDDAFGKGIAGTGRITSSRPNIQNQPQSARRMFIPSNRELVLLEGDFSQIEARILAQLADDKELKMAIAEGLHTSNMRVLGVDKTRAKNGFYGWAYGAGKRTLHNTFIGRGFYVSEADCEALLRGFDRRFAATAAFRHRIAREVTTMYHLTNVFGRRRYFLGGSRDVPAGLDFHPQSCAADIMWTVLRPLADQLREVDARILATVHDSILVECPRTAIREAAGVMRGVMEQPWKELGGLVVPIELKTGMNWGAMEELHA